MGTTLQTSNGQPTTATTASGENNGENTTSSSATLKKMVRRGSSRLRRFGLRAWKFSKVAAKHGGRALNSAAKQSGKALKKAGETIDSWEATQNLKDRLAYHGEVAKAVFEHTKERLGLDDKDAKREKEKQRLKELAARKNEAKARRTE